MCAVSNAFSQLSRALRKNQGPKMPQMEGSEQQIQVVEEQIDGSGQQIQGFEQSIEGPRRK